MNLVWKVHSAVRHALPNPWIKRARSWLEVSSDAMWRAETYSQCGEDRVLLTLLQRRAAGIGNDGFYVDVGAFSPKQFSNTYLFYKRGWRGINVDATPGSMRVFRQARPRDINVESAVSDEPGELTFFTWGTPTVINTLSPEHAAAEAQRIGKPPAQIRVQARTLRSILEENLPSGQAIDFMSVDVEAHDLNVLRSNDWTRYRPEFVLIELLKRDMHQVLHSEIQSFMLGQRYTLASWVYPNLIYERVDS